MKCVLLNVILIFISYFEWSCKRKRQIITRNVIQLRREATFSRFIIMDKQNKSFITHNYHVNHGSWGIGITNPRWWGRLIAIIAYARKHLLTAFYPASREKKNFFKVKQFGCSGKWKFSNRARLSSPEDISSFVPSKLSFKMIGIQRFYDPNFVTFIIVLWLWFLWGI